MEPKLKPRKGWRYRVIVCTETSIKFDDVDEKALIVPLAEKLSAELAG